MNLIKKLSFFALAALIFASCKDTSKDGNIETPAKETVTDSAQVKETASANVETTTFKIDGMTCPMGCAATIEKKLASLEGVSKAKVDFDAKTATVSFDASKQTPEKLVETVEHIADGAYKVSDVKNSGDKAYFSVEQEKQKKADKKTADKKSADAKPACCSADKKADKKAGCCSADKKATKGTL